MSKHIYKFIESNLPADNFAGIPVVPVTIRNTGDFSLGTMVWAIVDTGSTNSFIDVLVAELLRTTVAGNLQTSGVSGTERKPTCNLQLSNEALDGNWVEIVAGIIDCRHPNVQAILGRDFLDIFKSITYSGKDETIVFDFQAD